MSELCIILTAKQAQRDWNGSRKGTALRPAPLADGETYVLPARVLERPSHAAHHEFLKGLPARVVEDEEFVSAQSGGRVALPK